MIVTNSLTGGGAERSMNALANALYSLGQEVEVVAINASGDDLVSLKCNFYCLNRAQRAGVKSTLKAYISFCAHVFKHKPDYILLNCDLPEFFGALLPNFSPLVVVEHSPRPFVSRKHLGFVIRKLHYVRGSRFVRVSNHLQVWSLRRIQSEVIPNALPEIENDSNPKKLSKHVHRLVYIGRLSSLEKNPGICLSIAKSQKLPIIFLGDGPDKISLQEESVVKKVDAEFKGHVEDPWRFVGQRDLLIIPSKFEGDGLVVIEAILHEVPFLLSDIPDFRRFNLPDFFYCGDLENFSLKIDLVRAGKLNLSIPSNYRNMLAKERNPLEIASQWIKFLTSNASFEAEN
jgi:glycosyltransferase involved in cell wall biosynthesis